MARELGHGRGTDGTTMSQVGRWSKKTLRLGDEKGRVDVLIRTDPLGLVAVFVYGLWR